MATLAAAVTACGDRERPITPTGGGGGGGGPVIPLVTIIEPSADTVVPRDTALVIKGEVQDDLSVDSIFIDIQGAPFSIPPTDVSGTLVPYSFTFTTAGLGGTQVTISVSAKDEDGNLGGPAVRILSVQ